METSSSSLLDLGYSWVSPGCIASIATFLEMREAPAPASTSNRADITLNRLRGSECDDYLRIFTQVGAPWLWFSRLALPPAEVAQLLDNPQIMAFAALKDDKVIGLVELDFRQDKSAELAFFGLVPEAIGFGLGRSLLDAALALAWTQPIRRLMVHTCTLDHPMALAFYQRAGFHPYARAVEVADDPRLTGLLPRDCAPHVPLIAP